MGTNFAHVSVMREWSRNQKLGTLRLNAPLAAGIGMFVATIMGEPKCIAGTDVSVGCWESVPVAMGLSPGTINSKLVFESQERGIKL